MAGGEVAPDENAAAASSLLRQAKLRSDQGYCDAVRGSVTMFMAAEPERVWSLVSDVRNIGRFSPETFEAEWLDGASGPAIGVRFRGHVRRNGKTWLVYWTTCTVTQCEVGRAFGFQVQGFRGSPSVIWNYRFEPVAGGVNVTESFELGQSPVLRLYAAFAGRSRTQTNIDNMRATLGRIKSVAESSQELA